MSKENLDQFINNVAHSEELQAKIGEEIDAEALIALGAECGCEFTAEELQESAELSDEELDEVAGGWSFHILPWHKKSPNKVIGHLYATSKSHTRPYKAKPCKHCGTDLYKYPHTHSMQDDDGLPLS